MTPYPLEEQSFTETGIEKVYTQTDAWSDLGDRISEDVRLSAPIADHERFEVYRDRSGKLFIRTYGQFLPELLRCRVNESVLYLSHAELERLDTSLLVKSRFKVMDNK